MLNEDYARLVVSKVLAATASRDPPSYITSTGSGPGSSSGDVAGDVKVQLQLILTSVCTAIKSRVLSLFGARTAAVPIDYIWAGANASTVWFMNTFMPRGTWVCFFFRWFSCPAEFVSRIFSLFSVTYDRYSLLVSHPLLSLTTLSLHLPSVQPMSRFLGSLLGSASLARCANHLAFGDTIQDVLYSKMYELHLLHQPSEPIGGPVENETTDSKKDL